MKLSKAQRNVLERLARGDKLHFLSGLYARCFWSGYGNETVSINTLHALETRKLTHRPSDGYDGFVNITAAGRAALAELDADYPPGVEDSIEAARDALDALRNGPDGDMFTKTKQEL